LSVLGKGAFHAAKMLFHLVKWRGRARISAIPFRKMRSRIMNRQV
jgi:hypothetical protein